MGSVVEDISADEFAFDRSSVMPQASFADGKRVDELVCFDSGLPSFDPAFLT
jgi:hypothetical protein